MSEQKIAGFEYRGTAYGGQAESPRRVMLTIKDAETLRMCDMLNAEIVSNETRVDLAVAADTGLIGIADEYKVSPSAAGAKIRVVANPDALYAVKDDNVRHPGDLLKLGTGGSGQQVVVAGVSGDAQFEVFADTDADEWTLVRIANRAAFRNAI